MCWPAAGLGGGREGSHRRGYLAPTSFPPLQERAPGRHPPVEAGSSLRTSRDPKSDLPAAPENAGNKKSRALSSTANTT